MLALFILVAIGVITQLAPQAPVRIPKAPGSFDYMLVDAPKHRLLVAHTGSHAFAVLNSDTGALETQIYLTGAPHGIAIDLKRDAYLVSTSLVPQVVVIGRRSLGIASIIRMPGPVDAIALDSKRDLLYADEDNGQSIWVVDGTGRIVETLKTPQDSDKSEYDQASDRLYQNFTTINATFVIDGATSRVVERWSTLPATKPHGIALDHARGRVYIAGINGKLVALDAPTGKPLSIAAVARDVDQIAYDSKRSLSYCASGDGFISVVRADDAGLTHISDVSVPLGAHTLALDASTGAIWISYGTQRDDYVMRLLPSATP
jgi:DNA-binding beta-propeller fold protein YncE